ncbi:MAG TPA: aminotransferase class IV, partial [Gemmatimonadales bacterium]|nr:aminotransferase class IV [Gemmatimonadales bacterium]
VVSAPPLDNLILAGITYELVRRLAEQGHIGLELRRVPEAELRAADEIWLSSSTKEVLAVTTLDGRPVGDGQPGPLFRRIHALYQDYKAQLRDSRPVAA